MKQAFLLLSILLTLIGCHAKIKGLCPSEPKKENTVKSANVTAEELDSIPFLIPKCPYKDAVTTKLDSRTTKWYNSHLAAMEEPLLGLSCTEDVCYRFLWLRCFRHPVLVSFAKSKDNMSVKWKVLDGAGGYDPGKIIVSKDRKLTIEEWNSLKQIIMDMEFWSLSTLNRNGVGFDGDVLVVEGKCGDTYHIVNRYMPEDTNSFRQGCLKLLTFTDIEIPEGEMH